MQHDHLMKLSILFKDRNEMEIGQKVSEEKLFNNIKILYMYTAQGQGNTKFRLQLKAFATSIIYCKFETL